MGTGSSGLGGNNRGGGSAKSKFTTVTDDYGREVRVAPSIEDIPKSLDIWTSGGFSKPATGDHYIVFAKINGTSVDTSSLMGLKVSLSDLSGVSGIGGWRSWKTSAEADRYIKRYDKSGASAYTRRRVERAKAFAAVMKKLGR